MTRGLMLLWWLLALLLAPFWLPLALYTRRTALRLPPAEGPAWGEVAGSDPAQAPLRLLLIGESTVAGVGVARHEQGLAANLARALVGARAVQWRALGENGITIREACQCLQPQASGQSADWVLLVFGVNDTTHFSSLRSWRLGITALADDWQKQGARVVVTAVPPLAQFTALPWLVRKLFGLRAGLLDRALRERAASLDIEYCAPDIPFEPQFLAQDGYHPSEQGYRLWAQRLAQQLRQPLA